MMTRGSQIPLALYLHFPWCKKKCPYCDFNSHTENTAADHRAYLDAMLADLEIELAGAPGRPLVSVYCGGGTPSLFAAEHIERLLDSLRKSGRLLANSEITLEANPGTLERGRFAEYRAAGINRISLGAQSFNDDCLAAIGRIHGSRDIYLAVEELQAAGVDNFNLDVMFGLPGQTLAMARRDLSEAVKLDPAHLSRYQLTLEPNTPFHAQPPPLPDEDLLAQMELDGFELLQSHGFERYEISAWAKPGKRCRHNLNYWEFGDYLGVGAGAHGKLGVPHGQYCLRRMKPRHPLDYLRGPAQRRGRPVVQRIAGDDLVFEFFLNALRLVEGTTLTRFTRRTGLPAATPLPTLETALERGLLAMHGEYLRPTERGLRFLNDLQALFLPSARAPQPTAGQRSVY